MLCCLDPSNSQKRGMDDCWVNDSVIEVQQGLGLQELVSGGKKLKIRIVEIGLLVSRARAFFSESRGDFFTFQGRLLHVLFCLPPLPCPLDVLLGGLEPFSFQGPDESGLTIPICQPFVLIPYLEQAVFSTGFFPLSKQSTVFFG